MIQLLLGDCLEQMKNIPDHSIDMVLADVPYGTTACKWDTVIPFEPMWKELKRVAKVNAAICLFGSEPFSSNLRMSNLKDFKYDWIWEKNYSGSFVLAKKRPMQYHEIISVFYSSQPTYNPIFEPYAESVLKRFSKSEKVNHQKAISRGDKNEIQGIKRVEHSLDLKRGKYPSSVQKFSGHPTCNGLRQHPTQKPVALLEYLIKTYTLPGETVLDFTMGSGSTGCAAKNLGRSFIGIERDESYFEIAKKRIENAGPVVEKKDEDQMEFPA